MHFKKNKKKSDFLYGSNEIEYLKVATGSWRFYNKISIDHYQDIVAKHLQYRKEQRELKRDTKRNVTRFKYDNVSYIVKDFIASLRPEFFSVARQSWLGSQFLRDYTVPCLAWNHSKTGGDFIIYLDAGPGNFCEKDYLGYRDIENLYYECGALLGELHLNGFYHADTKPSNFVVNSLIPELDKKVVIIDCDRVLCYSKMPPLKRCLKNAAQFLAGTKKISDLSQWLKFTKAFRAGYQEKVNLAPQAADLFWQNVLHVIQTPKYKIENHLTQKHFDLWNK